MKLLLILSVGELRLSIFKRRHILWFCYDWPLSFSCVIYCIRRLSEILIYCSEHAAKYLEDTCCQKIQKGACNALNCISTLRLGAKTTAGVCVCVCVWIHDVTHLEIQWRILQRGIIPSKSIGDDYLGRKEYGGGVVWLTFFFFLFTISSLPTLHLSILI